jgi:uncharacterized membrane protein (DUF2068 family)
MAVNNKMTRALRVVALFEACKGLLVLFAGLALFSFIHQNIQVAAEQLVGHLHLNPAKNIPRIFIEAAGNMTDRRIRLLALFALFYCCMRFVESYGLWFAKRWAEWFALVSGCVYLPIELYELIKGVTLFKIIFVSINLIIVVYMAVMLKQNAKKHVEKKTDIAVLRENSREES